MALNYLNLKQKTEVSSQVLLNKALALKGISKMNEALSILKEADRLDSTNNRIKLEMASTLTLLEDFAKAGSLYFNLWKTDTSNVFLLKNLALCIDNQSLHDSAIAYYTKVLKLNPADFQSTNRLANLYIDKKDYEKSLAISGNYQKIDSANNKNNRMHAYCYFLLKDYERAKKQFEKVIKAHDTTKFVCKFYGISCYKTEYYDSAMKYLEKVYAIDTTDAQVTNFLGLTYSWRNDPRGIELLNKTIQLITPNATYLSNIYHGLAEAYNLNLQYKEGLAAFLKAYELKSNDTILVYKLGNQYDFFMKDTALAIKYYTEFLKLRKKPNDSSPKPKKSGINLSLYKVAEDRLAKLEKKKAIQ
jgi:tetratricopeptide (TPR) repeat protein